MVGCNFRGQFWIIQLVRCPDHPGNEDDDDVVQIKLPLVIRTMTFLIEMAFIVVIAIIDAAVVIIISRHIPTSLPPLPTHANLTVATAAVVTATAR